ncbi:hypothetical protein BS78_06G208900 [Paspalum vaginatum]|nr:hypothetical protein BS78_06G208900 [Paspalum vaginatum]
MIIKVTLQLLVFASAFTMFVIDQVPGETDCHAEKARVIHKCSITIAKSDPYYAPPKGSCRIACAEADMDCVCRSMTPHVEQTISMQKLIFLSADSANPVTAGKQCGSITIPPRPCQPIGDDPPVRP